MRQSRLMSLVEAVANVVVGYGVAVLTQMLVFPLFGLRTTVPENLAIGAIFTVVSLVPLGINNLHTDSQVFVEAGDGGGVHSRNDQLRFALGLRDHRFAGANLA